MDKRDKILLQKILDEANIIAKLVEGFDCDSFVADEKTKRATCMTLINIGELVKLLSSETRQQNPDVPWRSIAGLRDVAVHGYMTLRMEDIWETVSVSLPTLKAQIDTIL